MANIRNGNIFFPYDTEKLEKFCDKAWKSEKYPYLSVFDTLILRYKGPRAL